MLLLWDVDTQVDFMLPGGKLYVPDAEKIIPNLRRLTAWAAEQHIPVISTACAHRPGDPELAIYGEHCIAGSRGQQKVPETLLRKRLVVPSRRVDLPDLHAFQQIVLEKREFDFTSNPNHAEVLWQFGRGLDIIMYGVATDICVASAASALFAMGHKVALVRDAIAEIGIEDAARFLSDFVNLDGRLISVHDVITLSRKRAA
ncbi:MAG TPA: isochorismatase family protein [Terriglobales bacterium]|jgi:nicotinamidase/pyrazinamidase|nr:isochorismatase family protein [Terriglobales bacterium]